MKTKLVLPACLREALRLLASTKVLRNGPTTAAKLKAGDKVRVVALMCSQGLVARTITATAKSA
jgi:hypothetical protein